MMRTRLVLAVIAAAALSPSLAFAQAQQPGTSTAGGAVGGAIIGGVVGGPVGAVVGAGIGGTVGLAAEPPAGVVTYVQRERVPSVTVRERVVVGQPLAAEVQVRTIPDHSDWSYAVVNDQRVIIEPKTRKVVKIIE